MAATATFALRGGERVLLLADGDAVAEMPVASVHTSRLRGDVKLRPDVVPIEFGLSAAKPVMIRTRYARLVRREAYEVVAEAPATLARDVLTAMRRDREQSAVERHWGVRERDG